MKKVTLNLRDETYEFILLFRECAVRAGEPLTNDDVAEMAFKVLHTSFMGFMEKELHKGQA